MSEIRTHDFGTQKGGSFEGMGFISPSSQKPLIHGSLKNLADSGYLLVDFSTIILSYLEGQNFQPQDYCTIWEEVRYPLTHRPKCLHFIISSTCHLKDKKRGPGEPQSSFPDRKDRAFSGNRRAQFMQRRWAREHAMGPRTGPLLKPKREKVLGYPNI